MPLATGMSKKKVLITAAIVLVVALGGVFAARKYMARDTTEYRFVTIERGDIQSTVSATGTLNAVTTVSVGTQVSGQVSQLLVDYNDKVTKGQLLARIDPTLAKQSVIDAQANLEKAEAQARQASRDFARNRELAHSGLVARSELEQTQSTAEVGQAGIKSARVALDRARQNLSFTSIYAPIDGVVIERNVQQGQTVAASLSAPQLFLIANDLSKMQILAQVGESDIAQIKEGQDVTFTVQALQGQTFKGTVAKVRLQSTTTDNVVNYTVVVSVDNPDGKLLPGMTARVEFLTKSASEVLKVANAALRFKPTEEQLAALKKAREATATTTSTATDSSATSTAGPGSGRGEGHGEFGGRRQGGRGAWAGSGGRNGSYGTLYYLDEKGNLAVARVRMLINDGSMTEIRGRNIKEGMKVIAGIINTAQKTQGTSTAATPFQGGQQQGGQGGPRGGGGGPRGAF